MYKLYLPHQERNVVTNFYISIIKQAIYSFNENVEMIDHASLIKGRVDNVVTVSALSAITAWKHNARKIINWWQGIIPEESYFRNINKSFLEKNMRQYILSRMEHKALKHVDVHLFVSDSMRRHYAHKYGFKSDQYVIMPCFNDSLHKSCFSDKHYAHPTFVYAGGLTRWQCFEPMVKLFSEIKHSLPEATLALYVRDCQQVHDILDKYRVEAIVKYVCLEQLSEEMKKYKYGFILRDDMILNRVATPTKMSTYLSSGVIPIYTDVVDSFHENLGNLQYAVPLSYDGKSGLEKLIKLENTLIKGADVEKEYSIIFQTFYSAEYYIPMIAAKIKGCCEE